MFCRKCGTQLPDDAMFCSECGAATRNYQNQQQSQQQPYQQPQQPPYQQRQQVYQEYSDPSQYQQPYRGQHPADHTAHAKAKFSGGSKGAILTVAIIAVIAVAVGLLYTFVLKSSTPQDTIHDLEKAIEDLDLEKMIACFDEETRKEYEEGMEQFGDLDMDQALSSVLGLAGGLGIGPKVDLTVTDIEYTGSTYCEVSVDVSISFMGESEETSDILPMKKEGKKWVIDGSAASDILGGLF